MRLASDQFCCTAIRNATVFGLSPRMRFDLVINLMTLNAVQKGKIFVLGGGRQWRPIVHVRDVARAFITILKADRAQISGQVFNVGLGNYQVLSLAYMVREVVPFPIEVEVAPDDDDKRDYNVSFSKIEKNLRFQPLVTVADGIREIYEALKLGNVFATPETVTVSWYRRIIESEKLIKRIQLNDRLI
jgi:nucleoside-diphosphate-sugar epimerase